MSAEECVGVLFQRCFPASQPVTGLYVYIFMLASKQGQRKLISKDCILPLSRSELRVLKTRLYRELAAHYLTDYWLLWITNEVDVPW